MGFLVLLLLYLSLPFIELGIIIFLAISRNHYKNMAEQMKPQPKPMVMPVGSEAEIPLMAAPIKTEPGSAAVACMPVEADAAAPIVSPPDRTKLNRENEQRGSFQQGTVPFVIGVIFVILAGFIFATTTWSILPSGFKAALVLMMTALFFGASVIADKKFHIKKTGKAFYILGSIFLFVSVMAFGYFGLLGPDMTPLGEDRMRLFFIGMLLTETALLWGRRLFKEKAYLSICFYGITLTVALLIASWKLPVQAFTFGMTLFGGIVIAGKHWLEKGEGIYSSYAAVNLWLISVLILIQPGFGLLSGLSALIVGGTHFYQGRQRDKEGFEAFAFTTFLIIGFSRALELGRPDEWTYLITITMFLMSVMNYFEWFGSSMEKGFSAVHAILALLTVILLITSPILNWELTLSSLICMGILLADITVTAWKQKTIVLYAAHSTVLVLFIHYVVFYMDMEFTSRLFLIVVIMGMLLWAGVKGWYPPHAADQREGAFPSHAADQREGAFPLCSRIGDIISTTVILADVLILITMRLLLGAHYAASIQRFVMEILVVLILTAAVWGWGKRYALFRQLTPFALVLGLVPVYYLSEYLSESILQYDWFLLGYLLLVILWDLLMRKNEDYRIAVTILGILSAVFCFHLYERNLPFMICLSIYLFVKAGKMEEKKDQTEYFYLGCVSGLVGIYLIAFDHSSHLMLQMFAPAAALIAGDLGYRAAKRYGQRELPAVLHSFPQFSAAAGSLIYTAAAIGFYHMPSAIGRGAFRTDGSLNIWYLVPLLLIFLWNYRNAYVQKQPWWHILPSLLTLALPYVLRSHYGVERDIIYTVVPVTLIVTTGLARKYAPIVWKTADQDWRIDWFHILQILLILSMGMTAQIREWTFIYVLLTAGYTLQYCSLPEWRRPAVTAAGVIGCFAFWIQPFVIWPEVLWLEIRLIPAACLVWALGVIWGRTKTVWDIQTVLYALCLGLLSVGAFCTQRLENSLILEGICLTVFLVSYQKKCSWWVKFSGGLAMGIVLYMTRGFWLSISWWIYLLAAGIGLILFAAVNELKKR